MARHPHTNWWYFLDDSTRLYVCDRQHHTIHSLLLWDLSFQVLEHPTLIHPFKRVLHTCGRLPRPKLPLSTHIVGGRPEYGNCCAVRRIHGESILGLLAVICGRLRHNLSDYLFVDDSPGMAMVQWKETWLGNWHYYRGLWDECGDARPNHYYAG